MTEPIRITIYSTVGLYGTDQHGNYWTTYLGGPYPCAVCGTPIRIGWRGHPPITGQRGTEMFACPQHVIITPHGPKGDPR